MRSNPYTLHAPPPVRPALGSFAALDALRYDEAGPLYRAIYDQLPEGVRRRVELELTTDPYHLATRARFITANGRVFECRLQTMTLDNGKVACARVPETFVTYLCVAL